MKYQLQILGSADRELTPSIMLQFASQSYLFNAGEGTQRFCTQHKIRLGKIQNIFLTRMNWDCLGGFPGMSLTLGDMSPQHINIHGPKGLNAFQESTNRFIRSFSRSFIELDSQASFFKDENISINSFSLYSDALKPQLGKRRIDVMDYSSNADSEIPCITYLCKGPERKGKFNPASAKRLGLSPGPNYSKLSNGECVSLADGTIIHPSQCVGPSTPGALFLVLDCPSKDYIHDVTTKISKSRILEENDEMTLIIHMLGVGVLEDPRYAVWMSEFGDKTQHIILSKEYCSSEVVFSSHFKILNDLNHLDDQIFKVPYNQCDPQKDLKDVLNLPKKCIAGKSLLQFEFEPKTKLVESTLSSVVTPPNPEFTESAENIKKMIQNLDSPKENLSLTVIALGTGSAIPGKYRNVSANLVQLSSGSNILLDAGEGTLGQLYRHFGPEKLKKVLNNLDFIFISHLHADHHLGLICILRELYSLNETKKVYIVTPNDHNNFLNAYSQFEQFGLSDKFVLLNAASFLENSIDSFCNALNDKILNGSCLSAIQTVRVDHCQQAFAIVFKDNTGVTVAYSGDCRPSNDFIKAGQGATVLIHEATFDDDTSEEAIKKKHCTISEAIQVGKSMGAKNLLLTHFSQRFAKFPNLQNEEEGAMNIGLAFDLMSVSLNNFNRMSLLIPELKKLFNEEVE